MKPYLLVALFVACIPDTVRGDVPVSIPVVTTWQQLYDAPVVATGDFGNVRVGIEANAARKLGGVVVYGLVQRDVGSKIKTRFDHDDVLGPLHCRIYRADAPVTEQAKMLAQQGGRYEEARELLYTRAVFIHTAGEYRVELSVDGKQILAATTIKGSDQPYHAWTPFSISQRVSELHERGEHDDDLFLTRLSARPRGAGLPSHDGMTPINFSGEQRKCLPDQPLPKLIPTNASRTLTLQGDHRELLIESESKMIVARPDWHYLARWWINDKPFQPQPAEKLADQNGMITSGRRVHITLDFDPTDFGAQSGDKIGLQLLHLPNGWQSVDEYGMAHLAAAHDEGPNVSRMTNRIEFTAP